MLALQIALGFVTAAAFSLALMPIVLKVALAYGLYDVPETASSSVSETLLHNARKVHTAPIPRLGGIAIVISFFLTYLIWNFDTPLTGPLVASVIIFFTGLVDDLEPVPARIKLLIQTIAASIAIFWGKLWITGLAFTPSVYINLPDWVGFAFSVFMVVGAINAINMIDGLDGLAGGVVLIAVTLLSFLYFITTQDTDLLYFLTLPLVGAILGFLRYNTHPASIFMGDSGSNWLGFMTGILFLIVLSGKTLAQDPNFTVGENGHIPLISVILCLAIPIFDTACVMIARMKNGLSPMQPDQRHFHHTLLKIGLSQKQSVSTVYFLALAAGILGMLPVVFNQYNFAWLPYLVSLIILLVIPLSISAGKFTLDHLMSQRLFLREHVTLGVKISKWILYWEQINRYVLYFILLASPAFAGVITPTVGYAAAVAIGFILISSISRSGQSDFFDSMSIATAAIVLLVANNLNTMTIAMGDQRINIHPLYNTLFIFLFASTAILLLVTVKKRYLVFTPSDFLLLSIPMILLLLPDPIRSAYRLDIICLRSLVVFMALRTMMKRRRQSSNQLKVIVFIALSFVALSGIFAMRIVY